MMCAFQILKSICHQRADVVTGLCLGMLILMSSACVDCGAVWPEDGGSNLPPHGDSGVGDDGGQALSDGGHSTADGGAVDAGAQGVCMTYCSDVMNVCVGDDQQYASEEDCLQYCESAGGWAIGDNENQAENHAECRLAVLSDEPEDISSRCKVAGPSGGGACGDYCANYCDAILNNCTDENSTFQDRETCLDTCSHYSEDHDTSYFVDGDGSGDTFACRFWYAGLPASNSPETMCAQASASGGTQCRTPDPEPSCDSYCDLVTRHCFGEFALYSSEEACSEYCHFVADFDEGILGETSGNTLACRIHYGNAVGLDDPEAGCAAAGPAGGNVCGSWCDNYCDLAMKNCDGENALYDSRDSCMDACADLPVDDSSDALTGDAVQCRIDILGGPAYVNPELYCVDTSEYCMEMETGADGGILDAGSTDGGLSLLTCETYCQEIMVSCAGQYAQYDTYGECLDYCDEAGQWEAGEISSLPENTLGCRYYFAGQAALEKPEIYCGRAGFFGADHCGTWCENYCAVVLQSCQEEDAIYEDESDCMASCSLFSDEGTAGDATGDTVQCRLTQAADAFFVADITPYCASAGQSEYGVCSNQNCVYYCSMMDENCSLLESDGGVCEEDCAALRETGYPGATRGDTLQCRIQYADQAAETDDEEICLSASIASTENACVDGCAYYCDLTETACTDGTHDLSWSTTCLDVCASYALGAATETTGDTYYCRQHKAEKALKEPEIYCAHAGETSDVLCVDVVEDGGIRVDGGTQDAGALAQDAGAVVLDAGAGSAETDAGPGATDAGASSGDAGGASDAGTAGDAGAEADSGQALFDGGATGHDAGFSGADGGSTPGHTEDAGHLDAGDSSGAGDMMPVDGGLPGDSGQ
jgi:hypothetical protein